MGTIEKILTRIENEARAGQRFLPIVGPKKGRVLYLITKAIAARRVLDLGTLVGYSSILLSQAIGNRGRIVTVESDPTMIQEAKSNFAKARIKNIQLLEGDAKQAVRKLKGPFDLIFLDVWKEDYATLLPQCVRLLRKGGVLIADNALWDTEGMKKFRAVLEKTKALETTYLPIQDGMSFSVKR